MRELEFVACLLFLCICGADREVFLYIKLGLCSVARQHENVEHTRSRATPGDTTECGLPSQTPLGSIGKLKLVLERKTHVLDTNQLTRILEITQSP